MKKTLETLKSNLIAVGVHAVIVFVGGQIAISTIALFIAIFSERHNLEDWLTFIGMGVDTYASLFIGSVIFVYLPAFLFLVFGTAVLRLPKPFDWKTGLRLWAFWALQAPFLLAFAFEIRKMPERLFSSPPIEWIFGIPIVTIFTYFCTSTVLWVLTNHLIKRTGAKHG